MTPEAMYLAADTEILTSISDFLYTYWLIFVLVGTGLFFTFATKFVQIRHFRDMWKQIVSKDDQQHGISSFQAFATGMASRVGIGNIVGVAIALSLGGPGGNFLDVGSGIRRNGNRICGSNSGANLQGA